MAYISTWINPLRQFGTLTIDLVLDDDEGNMPTVRKTFTLKDEIANDTYLDRLALAECARAVSEWNTELARISETQMNEVARKLLILFSQQMCPICNYTVNSEHASDCPFGQYIKQHPEITNG